MMPGRQLPGADDRQRLLSLLPALSVGHPRALRSASARLADSSGPHHCTASDPSAECGQPSRSRASGASRYRARECGTLGSARARQRARRSCRTRVARRA
jgi:hypothetical protein